MKTLSLGACMHSNDLQRIHVLMDVLCMHAPLRGLLCE